MQAKALRLQALLECGACKPVLIMPRKQWEMLNVNCINRVEIELRECPLSGIENDVVKIAVLAQKNLMQQGLAFIVMMLKTHREIGTSIAMM